MPNTSIQENERPKLNLLAPSIRYLTGGSHKSLKTGILKNQVLEV
jgi:hypothetical protein